MEQPPALTNFSFRSNAASLVLILKGPDIWAADTDATLFQISISSSLTAKESSTYLVAVAKHIAFASIMPGV